MKLPRMFRVGARRGVLLGLVGAGYVVGCRSAGERYVAPEGPLPANTVMLSQMMRELSDRPGFTESLLAELNHDGKKGPALLTPALADELRRLIVGKDWQGLDRFPGWTMRTINPTVRVVERVAGKDEKAEGLAAVHPGAPAAVEPTKGFIDLGPYALDKEAEINLREPSALPGFTTEGIVSELGDGVVRGDGPNAFAPEHAESQRLADLLNRLSLNKFEGAKPLSIHYLIEGQRIETPEDLIAAFLLTGSTVEVSDVRYFANFGHFHYKGQDVMMPFWVNSQILVPGTTRPLLVPVSHAEYEWKVRGEINADVSWYFGVDGKAEFRVMDTLDQPWVMGRHAHEYQGEGAVEVTRLAGKMVVAYAHQHQARPELPFGGYYALGVCQDSVAAIEMKMTGKTTLFPNTADASLFNDARDSEVNGLIAAIPKDRSGLPPEPERIFGSLPVVDTELVKVSIPGLGSDLIAVQTAWREGHLQRAYGSRHWIRVWLEALGVVLAGVVVLAVLPRRRKWLDQ